MEFTEDYINRIVFEINTERGYDFVDPNTLNYIKNMELQERIMEGDVAVLNIAA